MLAVKKKCCFCCHFILRVSIVTYEVTTILSLALSMDDILCCLRCFMHTFSMVDLAVLFINRVFSLSHLIDRIIDYLRYLLVVQERARKFSK